MGEWCVVIGRLFLWYLSNKSNFQEIFAGEILIRIQPTTLLQIFYEVKTNFKVILKSNEGPDDIVKEIFRHEGV